MKGVVPEGGIEEAVSWALDLYIRTMPFHPESVFVLET